MITLTISNILIQTLLTYTGIYYGLMQQQKFITLNLFKLSDIYLYTVKGSHTVYFRIEWVINLISTYLIQSAKFQFCIISTYISNKEYNDIYSTCNSILQETLQQSLTNRKLQSLSTLSSFLTREANNESKYSKKYHLKCVRRNRMRKRPHKTYLS